MRPLDDAFPGRSVPWTIRPLDDASSVRCAPRTIRPLEDGQPVPDFFFNKQIKCPRHFEDVSSVLKIYIFYVKKTTLLWYNFNFWFWHFAKSDGFRINSFRDVLLRKILQVIKKIVMNCCRGCFVSNHFRSVVNNGKIVV
jgi:hypothetical protein